MGTGIDGEGHGMDGCKYVSHRVLITLLLPQRQQVELTPAAMGPGSGEHMELVGRERPGVGGRFPGWKCCLTTHPPPCCVPTHAACQEDSHGTPSLGSRGGKAHLPSMP